MWRELSNKYNYFLMKLRIEVCQEQGKRFYMTILRYYAFLLEKNFETAL